MTDIERRYWELAHFYKGYLPAKEDNEVNSYVVMVKSDPPEWGTAQEDFETINLSRFEHNESPFENMEDVFSDEKMLFREDTSPSKTDSFEVSSPFRRDAHRLLNPERSVSACNESIDSNGGVTYNQHMASQNKKEEVAFYMCRKNDVVPPPFKYTMTSKKVNRCFYMCFQKNCYCGRPHVKQDAWHVRLDHLNGTAIIVSDNGQNRKINREDIVPTAGYLFAVGIVAIGVVKTVIPVLCRFNQDCRNGSGCLYIHANVERCVVTQKVASTPLSEAVQYLEGMADGERELFFNFLAENGFETVGDLQVLGLHAYEVLVNRIPPQWSAAFLALSLLRSFDNKHSLESALISFPRVTEPINLPPSLQRVGDLLTMSKKELYQINIQPHALDACEIIRDRFYIEDEYNIINLNKEPESSFFVKITNLIRGHAEGEGSAHFSWRKHDRSRPLVTSVFTYVDVTKCNCRPAPSAAAKEEDRTVTVALPPIDPKDVIGIPPSSWCRCPRYWVIAVNYELSTPSGSRCSEQNAMGKLASIGTPTWGVREVFVHGNNPKKESNPLFPCGVCENMLQKVNKDIFNRYGEDAVLYMYDATKPHKLVSLPFPEISHRDGNSFKQFVSQDLRSGVLQD